MVSEKLKDREGRAVTYQYYMDFKEKTEYAKQNACFLSYPIGTLLFGLIDCDWAALADEAATERKNAFNLAQTAQIFQKMLHRFDSAHHLLRKDAARLEKTGDPLYALQQWAMENERLKQRFVRLIEQVLDADGDNSDLTVLQRYYLLNKTDSDFRRFKQRMHEQLKVFQCMMCGDQPDAPITHDKVADLDITAAICYASDDLRVLIFMEFEYMVTENYALRKCDNCGRYFLPFSSLSRYCDRTMSNGKTCRDVAIRINYHRRLQNDDIRMTYVKNNNAYQMRVRRSGDEVLLEEYQQWKLDAREALSQWKNGQISQEEVENRIALPYRKRFLRNNVQVSE